MGKLIWETQTPPYVWMAADPQPDWLLQLTATERQLLAIDCAMATYDLEPGEKLIPFRLGTLYLNERYEVTGLSDGRDVKEWLKSLRKRLVENTAH